MKRPPEHRLRRYLPVDCDRKVLFAKSASLGTWCSFGHLAPEPMHGQNAQVPASHVPLLCISTGHATGSLLLCDSCALGASRNAIVWAFQRISPSIAASYKQLVCDSGRQALQHRRVPQRASRAVLVSLLERPRAGVHDASGLRHMMDDVCAQSEALRQSTGCRPLLHCTCDRYVPALCALAISSLIARTCRWRACQRCAKSALPCCAAAFRKYSCCHSSMPAGTSARNHGCCSICMCAALDECTSSVDGCT